MFTTSIRNQMFKYSYYRVTEQLPDGREVWYDAQTLEAARKVRVTGEARIDKVDVFEYFTLVPPE